MPSPLLLPSSASAWTFLAFFLAAFAALLRRLLPRPPPLASPSLLLLRRLPRRRRPTLLLCKSIPSSLDKLQFDPILVPGLDLLSCVLEIPVLRRIASASQILDAAAAGLKERLFPLDPPPLLDAAAASKKSERGVGTVIDDERQFQKSDGFAAPNSDDSTEAQGFAPATAQKFPTSPISFEKQLGWDEVMARRAGADWAWERRPGGGSSVVRLWSEKEAVLLGSLRLDAAAVEAVDVSAEHATVSLADASSGEISLWDIATASRITASWCPTPPPPPPPVSDLCINSERGLLVVAAANNELHLSDLKSRATMRYALASVASGMESRGDSLHLLHSDRSISAMLDLRKLPLVSGINPPESMAQTTDKSWSFLWESLLQTISSLPADDDFVDECSSPGGYGSSSCSVPSKISSNTSNSLVWRCAGLLRSMAAG